jgi:hypothetical protein
MQEPFQPWQPWQHWQHFEPRSLERPRDGQDQGAGEKRERARLAEAPRAPRAPRTPQMPSICLWVWRSLERLTTNNGHSAAISPRWMVDPLTTLTTLAILTSGSPALRPASALPLRVQRLCPVSKEAERAGPCPLCI